MSYLKAISFLYNKFGGVNYVFIIIFFMWFNRIDHEYF